MGNTQAKFLTGSTMRHVVVMSSTGATGLLALFLVDLLDMYFISLLGHVELAAAIGFAGTILFFSTSVSIGMSIAQGALVSRFVGAGDRDKAKSVAASVFVIAFLVGSVVSIGVITWLPELLAALGAKGEAAEKAQAYLTIILPSGPLLAVAMSAGAVLRALGDAKRSMYSTLMGGLVNAVLDPLFIFGFSMGVEGAATASVFARFAVLGVAVYGLQRQHQFFMRPTIPSLFQHMGIIATIALPAILTNVATPIGNAYVTSMIAQFGENYVAGYAVIGRISPVAFALIFSLSGAIGPIVGQNFGAQRWDRVSGALRDALLFCVAYCVAISLLLFLGQDMLISAFSLQGESAELVSVFCTFVAITFVFNGMLFVSNAAFNNLSKPMWSTLLNVGKATVGTIPFVFVGGKMAGAVGVLLGQAVGGLVFGVIGQILLRRLLSQCKEASPSTEEELEPVLTSAVPPMPFSSSRTNMEYKIHPKGEDDDGSEPIASKTSSS